MRSEPIPDDYLDRAREVHAKKMEQMAEYEYEAVGLWRYIWSQLFLKGRYAYIGDIRVWKLNDFEWIAARTIEEGIEWYLLMTGVEWADAVDDPYECPLSTKMQRECEMEDGFDEVTFEEEIRYHAKRGGKFPMIIACTEY
jgi:hypothetical protein